MFVCNISKSVCCWVRTGRGDNNINVTKKIRFKRERVEYIIYGDERKSMVDRNGQRIAKRVSFFVLCRIDLNKFTSPKKKKKVTRLCCLLCHIRQNFYAWRSCYQFHPQKRFQIIKKKKKVDRRRLFPFCFSRRCWAKIVECNTGLLIKSLLPPSYLKNGVRKERPTRSFKR